MNANNLSLRKLATILGVSQPFLSQIRAGKRPLPAVLKTKVQALGAYHLLIGDKQAGIKIGGEAAAKENSVGVENAGRGGENRTPDLLLPKQAPYRWATPRLLR